MVQAMELRVVMSTQDLEPTKRLSQSQDVDILPVTDAMAGRWKIIDHIDSGATNVRSNYAAVLASTRNYDRKRA